MEVLSTSFEPSVYRKFSRGLFKLELFCCCFLWQTWYAQVPRDVCLKGRLLLMLFYTSTNNRFFRLEFDPRSLTNPYSNIDAYFFWISVRCPPAGNTAGWGGGSWTSRLLSVGPRESCFSRIVGGFCCKVWMRIEIRCQLEWNRALQFISGFAAGRRGTDYRYRCATKHLMEAGRRWWV
jgi:hypothetical protein